MKTPNLKDDQLGSLLSLVVLLLVLAIIYLVILLPFSGRAAEMGGAIAGMATLVGIIIGLRAARQR